MPPDFITYPRYRFPTEIISHAVWLTWVASLHGASGVSFTFDSWLEPVFFCCDTRAAAVLHGSAA
jgi:hypothetical protein